MAPLTTKKHGSFLGQGMLKKNTAGNNQKQHCMVELGSFTTYNPSSIYLQLTWHILMTSFRRGEENKTRKTHTQHLIYPVSPSDFEVPIPSQDGFFCWDLCLSNSTCCSSVATTLHNLRRGGTEVFDQKKPSVTLTCQAEVVGFLRGGCSRGREDWGTLGNIREY